MFFRAPVAAFANIDGALRPGGRLCLLAWQPLAGNEWLREFMSALAAGRNLTVPLPGAPGPFAFSDSERIRTLLTTAGFTRVQIGASSGGMWFGRDADDAYRFVRALMSWMLNGLNSHGRYRALGALRATIAAHDTGDGVIYQSAAWTVRATRP